MKNAAHPPEIDQLLRTAEQDAEQIVGLLRMGVAAGLGVFFLVTIQPVSNSGHAVLERQWAFAFGTLFAYFLLGFVTWIAARRGRFRVGWRGLCRARILCS